MIGQQSESLIKQISSVVIEYSKSAQIGQLDPLFQNADSFITVRNSSFYTGICQSFCSRGGGGGSVHGREVCMAGGACITGLVLGGTLS